MSSTRCVGLRGKTLIDPVVVGTIAMLFVIAQPNIYGFVNFCGNSQVLRDRMVKRGRELKARPAPATYMANKTIARQ
jgi:hypothetical protein